MSTTPQKQDLIIQQKTTKTYQLKFRENGVGVDITGWTVFFTVKSGMADADADAKISKTITTHTNPTAGETDIVLSSSDYDKTPPGSYVYDIKIKDNATPATILIVAIGRLTIERIVTQRES